MLQNIFYAEYLRNMQREDAEIIIRAVLLGLFSILVIGLSLVFVVLAVYARNVAATF